MPTMHVINSSRLRVGRSSTGEVGNALLLSDFMHVPHAVSAKSGGLEQFHSFCIPYPQWRKNAWAFCGVIAVMACVIAGSS